MASEAGYNERLFSGRGLRNYYHTSRYKWVSAQLADAGRSQLSIIEVGCFDGKLIEYVPVPIQKYVGIDANWENGLDIGRRRYGGRPEVELLEARTASLIERYPSNSFDVAVALETLEHIHDGLVNDYLAQLARVTRDMLLVSVPNEMGPVFLAKYLAKKALYGGGEKYSAREVVAATFRTMSKVARDEHKGFDYRQLCRQINRHFRVVKVLGVGGLGLPAALSPTVGIVAYAR